MGVALLLVHEVYFEAGLLCPCHSATNFVYQMSQKYSNLLFVARCMIVWLVRAVSLHQHSADLPAIRVVHYWPLYALVEDCQPASVGCSYSVHHLMIDCSEMTGVAVDSDFSSCEEDSWSWLSQSVGSGCRSMTADWILSC